MFPLLRPDFYEQSSTDIWRAVTAVVGAAITSAGIDPQVWAIFSSMGLTSGSSSVSVYISKPVLWIETVLRRPDSDSGPDVNSKKYC